MIRMAAVLIAGLIAGAGSTMAQSSAPAEAQAPQPQEQIQSPGIGSAPPPASDGRYTFHRMNDGFVRLDSRTGQVAQCGQVAAGWTCTVAPEERAAMDAEIARVQSENAALKRELLARGIELPAGVRPEPPQVRAPEAQTDARPGTRLPAEAELDRAFNFMKGVWRRLIEMMAELQRDIQRKS